MELVSPPTDSVTSMCFSSGNHLCATSWDKQTRVWEVLANGQSQPKAAVTGEAESLCSAWRSDGQAVFLGGCDKTVKLWTMGQPATQTIGMHDAPVKAVSWIEDNQLVATGSWDKTIRYWDTRSPQAVLTTHLSERVYSMDVSGKLLVAATADRNIHVIDLNNPQKIFKSIVSPLKYQTRCVAAFPDATGFLVGSIEGRVAVHHVDDAQQTKNFTFKCHRWDREVFAVNSMSFHPQYGTFVTAGADGAYNFWDKDSKQRLKQMPRAPGANGQPSAITCGAFNRDGTIYAHAVNYDWSKGAGHATPGVPARVVLHATQPGEIQNRPKKAAGKR